MRQESHVQATDKVAWKCDSSELHTTHTHFYPIICITFFTHVGWLTLGLRVFSIMFSLCWSKRNVNHPISGKPRASKTHIRKKYVIIGWIFTYFLISFFTKFIVSTSQRLYIIDVFFLAVLLVFVDILRLI